MNHQQRKTVNCLIRDVFQLTVEYIANRQTLRAQNSNY